MTSPKETIRTILKTKLDDTTVNLWLAVAAHETDGFTSTIFNQNNNAFSMRWCACGGSVGDPRSLAIGNRYGHDVFSSVADSAKDLILYFKRLGWVQLNFATPEALVHYMKQKGFFVADESDYLAGVKRWLS